MKRAAVPREATGLVATGPALREEREHRRERRLHSVRLDDLRELRTPEPLERLPLACEVRPLSALAGAVHGSPPARQIDVRAGGRRDDSGSGPPGEAEAAERFEKRGALAQPPEIEERHPALGGDELTERVHDLVQPGGSVDGSEVVAHSVADETQRAAGSELGRHDRHHLRAVAQDQREEGLATRGRDRATGREPGEGLEPRRSRRVAEKPVPVFFEARERPVVLDHVDPEG